MFIYREAHVDLYNSSEDGSFITCQITSTCHGKLPHNLVNLQLASQKPFSGQVVPDECDSLHLSSFFGLLPTHSQYFRDTLAKKTYPQTPARSRGHIRQKANTRGGLWQSLAFGSLAAALGICV